AALAAAGRGLACGLGLLARRLGGILRLGLLLAAGGGLLAAPRLLAHPHAGSARHARHARHPRHAAAGHAAAHALHHLLSLLEAREQLVALLHGGAGAPREASATRAVEDLGVAALLGRHRADDGLDAAQLGFVEVVERLPVLAHVRQHAQHLLDAA